jgi:serine/threonine protein phosphatase PrpC
MSSQQLVDFIHERINTVSKHVLLKIGNCFLNFSRIEVAGSDTPWMNETNKHLQESSLSAVCERVLDRCLAPSTIAGDGCDNMTMILVQFKKPVDRNKKAEAAGQSASNADEAKSRWVHALLAFLAGTFLVSL